MWDLASGQSLARIGPVEGLGRTFAPDGSGVLGYNATDKVLQRWDLSRPRPGWTRLDALELAALLEAGGGRSTRYRVNTSTTTTSSGLQLVDDQTGQTRPLGGPAFRLNSPATATAIGPRDDLVLTGGADGATRLWLIATGAQVGPTMMSPGPVNSVAFAPDARTIVITSGRAVRLWDLTFGRPIGRPMEHPEPIVAAQFSPDGRWIVAMARQPGAYRWPMPTPESGQPTEVIERIRRRTGSPSIAGDSTR
jgi:WD40 repeat protein